MIGRYGVDQLGRFLCIAIVVVCVVSLFLQQNSGVSSVLSLLYWALLIYSFFRIFSRNISKRRQENDKYLSIKYKITQKFNLFKRQIKDRKDYKYFSCPQCGRTVRVPKGKGKVRITCPNCDNAFIKNT